MKILGLSAYYHDSAACLVSEGEIIAAAQEERFTRRKHDSGYPSNAVQYCLNEAGLRPADIDYVVFYDKPFLKFERLLETYLAFAPLGFRSFATSLPIWLKDKLFQKTVISDALKEQWGKDTDWSERLLFSEHHLSHAASAFFPSPYEEAAVLTMDGVGEWTTTSLAIGKGNQLLVHKEIHFPHSLGLLYSAFTYYTGFKVNSGEYKVMGLAPYGTPKYVDLIKDHLIDIKEGGSFHLDMSYFNYCTGLTMTNARFDALFGGPPRKSESLLTQREMDLAASVQAVTEEVVIKLARGIRKSTGQKNLCLAGGVALRIIYGFIDDHLRRNVTPCASTYGPYCLYVPTVRKNDNGDFYIDDNIPLDNVSASIDYFEWARRKDYVSFDNIRFGYLAVRDRIAAMLGRQMVTLPKDDWIPATEFVINEMGKIARRNGAKLLVVNVGIGSPAENFHYLSSRAWDENIAFLDASEFDIPNEELFLKGDGHPNAQGHSLIAEKVGTFVDRNKLLVHDKSTFNKTVSH